MKYSIVGLILTAACSLHAAGITNGNFETGTLAGWSVTGNVYPVPPTTGLVNVLSNEWSDFTAAEGTYYAELSNSPNVNLPPVHDFSAITSGPHFVVPGSNGTISFKYILATNEYPVGIDYGEFAIVGALNQILFSKLYPISAIDQSGGCTLNAAPDGTSLCAATGWIDQSFSLTAYEGQSVSFRFSIYDDFVPDPQNQETGDNGFDSALLLDAVSATGLGTPSVPEPTTFLLGGSALLALGYLRKRASR